MSTKLIGVLLLVSTAIYSFIIITDDFLQPIVKGTVDDPVLSETSGIVSSIKNKGFLWAHNDSGDLPKLYLLDTLGQIKKTFKVSNASNFDWEDIAIQYDSTSGKSYIYVGDIGDNFGLMPFRTIYKMEEPDIRADEVIAGTEKMLYKYPDGPRDAETLMVSPHDASIHIISKREKQVHYYHTEFKAFKTENDTVVLDFKGKLAFHNVVAGDISLDGNKLLLKTYDNVYFWNVGGDVFSMVYNQVPENVKTYVVEPQGESICWNLEGSGFYTLSEKKGKNNPKLYYYPNSKH